MKPNRIHLCPRCEYPLVPVHAVEDKQRRVVAFSCPEPYCDHMQMITKEDQKAIQAVLREVSGQLKSAAE